MRNLKAAMSNSWLATTIEAQADKRAYSWWKRELYEGHFSDWDETKKKLLKKWLGSVLAMYLGYWTPYSIILKNNIREKDQRNATVEMKEEKNRSIHTMQTLLSKSDFQENLDKKKGHIPSNTWGIKNRNAQTDKREVKRWKITRAMENATNIRLCFNTWERDLSIARKPNKSNFIGCLYVRFDDVSIGDDVPELLRGLDPEGAGEAAFCGGTAGLTNRSCDIRIKERDIPPDIPCFRKFIF